MKQFTITILLALMAFAPVQAQYTYAITFTDGSPNVDGQPEPEYWANVPVAEAFSTSLPSFGLVPDYPTEVRMTYGKNGIYVSAVCHSSKVRRDGSQRDNLGMGDYFTLSLDTWNDDQNAFEFTVNASGQRTDAQRSSSQKGITHDAFWKAKTQVEADRWTLEMFIPFTALRFPKEKIANWGLQFTRFDRSTGQTSTWNPQNPLVGDVVLQYGQLEGLAEVQQKQRVGVGVMSDIEPLNSSLISGNTSLIDRTINSYSTIDGKIGIGSAATLDVSIVPGFKTGGDYPSFFSLRTLLDQHFSNFNRLSETESGYLFTKSDNYRFAPNAINSFFIPTSPVFQNPDLPKLLQKSRFTLRTRSNIGIGVEHSLYSKPEYRVFEANAYAQRFERPTHTTLALDKALRNNSWVQLTQSVFNFGARASNNYRTTAGIQLRDRSNKYELKGNFRLLHQNKYSVADGYGRLAKINGRWTYALEHKTVGQTDKSVLTPFMPGIVGISSSYTSERYSQATVAYNSFKKAKYWQNTANFASILHKDAFYSTDFTNTTFKVGKRALTHGFKALSAALVVEEDWGQYEYLYFPGTKISIAGVLNPMGMELGFTSDTRRRIILEATFQPTWVFGRNLSFYKSNCSLQWAATRTLALNGSINYNFTNNFVNGADVINDIRTVEVYDIGVANPNLGLTYAPFRKLNFEFNTAGVIYRNYSAKRYSFNENNGFDPSPAAPDVVEKPYRVRSLSGIVNFYPNAGSVIRLEVGYSDYSFVNLTPGPRFGQISEDSRWSPNLSFSFNLQRI